MGSFWVHAPLPTAGQLQEAVIDIYQSAVVTIGVDPMVEVGPLTLTWHGIMSAVGIAAGAWLATRYGRERGLDTEALITTVAVIALGGILGARLFYLAENDSAALLRPDQWFGTRGFSFYGAVILGTAGAAVYIWRARLGPRYLDALAAGFPLGSAVGRVGDLINGEHYGPATDVPWAFRYTHPNADVPSSTLAYHSGGFYEIVLALAMLAIVWPLRHRFRHPTTLLWFVVSLYATGRFVMFFFRRDSDALALGLSLPQWTSLALVGIAALGLWGATRFSGWKCRGGRSAARRAVPTIPNHSRPLHSCAHEENPLNEESTQ